MSEECGQDDNQKAAILEVISALVCYTRAPGGCLQSLCACLCQLTKEQHQCNDAWKVSVEIFYILFPHGLYRVRG